MSGSREAGHGATLGVFDGVKEAMTGRRSLAEALAGDPAVARAAHDLAQATVRGVADGVPQQELDDRADHLVRALLKAVRDSGDGMLVPLIDSSGAALDRQIQKTIRDAAAALRGSLDGLDEKSADRIARSLITTAVDATFDAVNQRLPIASEKLAEGVGRVAHEATKQAVIGAEEGLDPKKLHDALYEAGRGLGDGLKASIDPGRQWRDALIASAAVVGGSLFLLALAVAIYLWRQFSASTHSLAVIAEEINHLSKTDEAGKQLKTRIKERADRNHTGAWLSDFLKRRGL